MYMLVTYAGLQHFVPGPREVGEKGLVSTDCACVSLSVTVTCIHKGAGANDVFIVTWLSV